MAKGDDLEERFVKLAADVIVLCKEIPKDDGGNHLTRQLSRSGTSPAANYAKQGEQKATEISCTSCGLCRRSSMRQRSGSE